MRKTSGGLLKLREAQQNRRRVAIDKHLTSQVQADKLSQKAKQRAKINESLKVLLPAWREEMRSQVGVKCSRKQMLEALIPRAGDHRKVEHLVSAAQMLRKLSKVKGSTNRLGPSPLFF